MRVLPGMQSAFVDIGLERDAFLYVSDFFDEEEEIERIVMEKSKKSSPEEAKREADEQIQKARHGTRKTDGSRPGNCRTDRGKRDRTVALKTKRFQNSEKKRNQRRLRHAKKIAANRGAADAAADAINRAAGTIHRLTKIGRTLRKPRLSKAPMTISLMPRTTIPMNDLKTPPKKLRFLNPQSSFEIEDSGFERIVDDEDTGDLFKDAYRQEAIVDKVRAIEFDMESAATAEVGSLLGSVTEAASGFERIADDDEAQPAVETKKPKTSRGTRGGKNKSKTAKQTEAAEAPDQTEDAPV